jgi:predicted RNase H-like nuclease
MADVSPPYVGVDRDSSGWVAVSYTEEETADVDVFDTFEELCQEFEAAGRIVVDIPIGLCDPIDDGEVEGGVVVDDEAFRACDQLARDNIGPRHPSVFNPPARPAALKASKGEEYDTVNECNVDAVGKGLTQQAANISEEIMEVDEVLAEGADDETILEGHPEVCFRAFKGAELAYSKMTAAGVAERLDALESLSDFEGVDWRELALELGEEAPKVGLDDLLDALALLMTACDPPEELLKIPEEPPEDGEGRPVQMVYRADEPLPFTENCW